MQSRKYINSERDEIQFAVQLFIVNFQSLNADIKTTGLHDNTNIWIGFTATCENTVHIWVLAGEWLATFPQLSVWFYEMVWRETKEIRNSEAVAGFKFRPPQYMGNLQ